jgi:hypothetical protein
MRELETESQGMRKCLEDCQDCHRECLETLAHCLERGGPAADPETLLLLTACAEICRTSATFLALGTDLHTEVCAACAVVCEECADACERARDDERLQACAETCRRCAESCDEMTGIESDDDDEDEDE